MNNSENLNLNLSTSTTATGGATDLLKTTDFRCDDLDPSSNSCNFISNWPNLALQNPNPNSEQLSVTTQKSDHHSKLVDPFAMPVGLPSNQTAALDAVYGASNNGTERNLANNPYYNSYNTSGSVPYTPYNGYYPFTANSLRNPSAAIANYFGNAAAVSVNYYNYSASNLTAAAAAGFDYSNYGGNNVNNYYSNNSTAASSRNNLNSGNYYNNAALPYSLSGLTDSITAPTTSNNSQLSPYSGGGSIKNESKPTVRRSKKKKNIGLSTPEPNYSRVFIYELDDLCRFLTCRVGGYNILTDLVNTILMTAFQLQHIDECDQTNIEDANVDDSVNEQLQQAQQQAAASSSPDGLNGLKDDESTSVRVANEGLQRMALRYQKIRLVYNRCRDNPQELMNMINTPMTPSQIHESIKQSDYSKLFEPYTKCLKIATDKSGVSGETFANVILSSEPLSLALAKLLLTGLSAYVPAENVYSYNKLGEPEVLDRIINRYKKISLIISSNVVTSEIAKKENVPFWPVKQPKDVEVFHYALEEVLLK